MKFKNRLLVSFSLILLIFGFFGFLTIWQTRNMAGTYSRMRKFDINAIKSVEKISDLLLKIRSIEGEMLTASNEKVISKAIRDINEAFVTIKKTIPAYKKLVEDEIQLELIGQLDEMCDRHVKFNDELIKAKMSAQGSSESLQALFNNFQEDYKSMQQIIENIKNQEFSNLIGKTEKNIVFYDNIIFERVLIFIALMVIGFFIVFYFSERFSYAFDRVEERFKIEKLKANMLNFLRGSGDEIDYPKLLYMISGGVGSCFVSVFSRPSASAEIGSYTKSNSFPELEVLSSGGEDGWNIESFDSFFRHIENVREPFCFETERFFSSLPGGDASLGEAQRKFVGNIREKGVKSILIYPVLKEAKIVKYYVFYFREDINLVLAAKLDTIRELVGEAELLTDNISLMKELHAKNELLYNQNVELDAYASTVSHDLKNPLNAVSGYYQMLGLKIDKLASGENIDIGYLRNLIDKGNRASMLMKNLIDDILAFSRIKDASFKIEKFNSGEIVAGVAKLMDDQLRNSGIALNVARDLPDICADRNSIERVFVNLVSNSVKYMGQGEGKKIDIGWEESPRDYKFAVSDNGIGIAKMYHKSIFTPFFRTKENAGAEGTGLGLAITRKIIEKHGGKVWFESDALAGTTFYFTVPKKNNVS